MGTVLGVDGCRTGWVVALAKADDIASPSLRIVASMADIVALAGPDAIIVVDMPIGLPERIEGPGRDPERLVRPLLGQRQSSVFSIPARAAVWAPDYASACAEAAARSNPPKKVSRQGYMIFPKIREIDALLRGDPGLRERVVESHPEVVFAALHGGPLPEPKKVKGRAWPAGLALRRELLARAGLGAAALDRPAPRGAGEDDKLDALACLVTARAIAMGTAQSFPAPPARDAHDIPIAIWAPLPHKRPTRPREIEPMLNIPVTRVDIEAAAARIASHVRVTPVMELARGSLGGDWVPVLKLELLQHAGSFKSRGAFNNLLARHVPAAGVAAASGGNHGAAVAYAAARLGHKARIFVPEISSPAKIETIRRFGAEIVIGGARYDDAQAACDAHVAATGALRVHPFAAVETMAGQGVLAREWEAQSAIDSALIAVGGGGLIGGAAAWWAGQRTRVIGVEPEGSRALHAALAAGAPVDVTVQSVAADSLGARNVGELVHAVCRETVERVVLVSDEAILAAQRQLWQDFRLATEPGGAAAFAAIASGAYTPAPGERVGILICGGNVDLGKLRDVVA